MIALQDLKKQLVTKTYKPLYLMTGTELAIMDIYIQKIADVAGAKIVRADSIRSIYGKLQNRSFVSTPCCYVIRDDKDYAQQESLWQDFLNGTAQNKNIIILVCSSIDKRSKFYKHHENSMVEFAPLSPAVLTKYTMKELALSSSNAEKLVGMCDNNYAKILLECDKLKQLCAAKHCLPDEAFEYALNQKVIHVDPKDVIFEVIDSVCHRKIDKSFGLYEEAIAAGEHPLVIVSLLYNNMRSMLLVQSASGSQDICKTTGLTPFQVKLAREKGNNYSVGELVSALRIIREAERGIKTGTLPAEMAVNYILVNIL